MLAELFAEIFFYGVADASGNAKIPKAVRYMLFSVLCLIPLTVGVTVMFSSYTATGIVGSIISGVVVIALLLMWIFGLYKINNSKQ